MSEKYQPSNGTEGCGFVENFCLRCIHEKFLHTQDHDDKKCDIFSRTLLYDVRDDRYPEEWTYDENDNPTCTAHVPWDWGNNDDDENGGWNEPPVNPPVPDNQLTLPFIFDELEIPKLIKEEQL